MNNFKMALRTELNKQNLTIKQLAEMTNIKEQKIVYTLKNISNDITLEEALIISNALGKDIYEMCELQNIMRKGQSH